MKQVKQRKETQHETRKEERVEHRRSSKPSRRSTVVSKEDQAEVNLPNEDQRVEVQSSSGSEGDAQETEALAKELELKERVYINGLQHECQVLRSRIESQINTHLKAIGVTPERGNGRQRQLRELSWSFASLPALAFPNGFEILPCALSNSEVYQFTHLIQAFVHCTRGGKVLTTKEQVIVPLATKAKDQMQALEARKALYEFLLAHSELREETRDERRERGGHTLEEVWQLLNELNERLKTKGEER